MHGARPEALDGKVVEWREQVGDKQSNKAAVSKVNVPLAFYDEVYTLREHIDFVKSKISRLNQDSY